MDRVFIEDLRVETVIGHFAWEQQIRQELRLDIHMDYDCRAAGRSDALRDALDYGSVAEAVVDYAAGSSHHLLEALGEAIATLILRDFACRHVELVIRKPTALGKAAAVGIAIARDAGAP